MNGEPPTNPDGEHVRFVRGVEVSERRKQRSRQAGNEFISWLGTFGLVGWSIAVPTLVGITVGLWLDANYPRGFSWTLGLMLTGLMLGCGLAWYWVRRESRT